MGKGVESIDDCIKETFSHVLKSNPERVYVTRKESKSHITIVTTRTEHKSVLLCFMNPILENRYGPGGSTNEPRGTHPRFKIANVSLRPTPI